MRETEEPRAALAAPDVTTRAAAARDLAKMGEWSDLEALVRLACSDKSSAVRLYTAAAASDIAARVATTRGIDAPQAQQIHAWVKALDPSVNPGLLMMLAAVPDAAAIERLGRMMRDPRNGVRAGAVTAFRRLAMSARTAGRDDLRAAVVAWLDGGKLPPDMTIELVKLAGELGWRGLDAQLKAAARQGKLHATAVEEATARNKLRDDPAAWEGFYVSDGLDVLEVDEAARPKRWAAIDQGHWRVSGGGEQPFSVDGGVGRRGSDAARLVYAPRIGSPDAFVALQVAGETLWRQDAKDLAGAVDDWLESFAPADAAVLGALERWLAAVEGTTASRARAILLWRSGNAEAARVLLEELAGHKRPRADVFYWLGRASADTGRVEEAKAALDQFLEKAGKKAEWRAEAEALRGSLT